MKKIIVVGNHDENSILRFVTNSSKFKIKRVKNLAGAQKLIENSNPDFVLCAGKVKIDSEGRYFLEI